MFGIKSFTYCVKNDELRQLWIEIAQAMNFNHALNYMKNDTVEFEVVDKMWGSPDFWRMADEISAIAGKFDYSVEAGFLPPFELFDFEILSPEAQQALCDEADAEFNMIEYGRLRH